MSERTRKERQTKRNRLLNYLGGDKNGANNKEVIGVWRGMRAFTIVIYLQTAFLDPLA